MSFFIPEAMAQAGTQGPPENAGMIQFAMLMGIFVLFYFIAIRPQRKRQKEHAQMVSQLNKGDEVVTNGGLGGTVTKVGDAYLSVRVAEGVEVNIQKAAVAALPAVSNEAVTRS